MNHITLMGRLTADPEMRMTQSGFNVTGFTVAVDRPGKNKGTDFIRCTAWKERAEFIKKYFFKGRMIAVEGRLQSRSYEDKNGHKQTLWEVVVCNAYFCGDKATNPDTGYQPMPSYNEVQKPAQVSMTEQGFQGFVDVDDDEANEDDLPF